ncbi:MAG TPA: translation initiation factor IF-2 subunit alpha [Candidatus Thermoplasmatota archaeon]|nr:translation initiation factor IF-2 subunit alpha [Candidatus Thermoplasmatota archaeon]
MVKKREFPEDGELVVGTVKDVKNYGAFVTLDEYPGKEGFIHIAEIASGWVKYVRDHIRENQKVVCKVTGVDRSKGHVDLSLKRVNEHQRRDKINEWKNEQKAEKLFELLAKELKTDPQKAWDDFGHTLADQHGTLHAAFEAAAADPDAFAEGAKGDWVKEFVKIAQANIQLPSVEIKGQLEIQSEAPNGVEVVRDALSEIERSDYEDVKISVVYLGAPRYQVKVTAPDYKVAEEQMRKVTERAIQLATKKGAKASFARTDGHS